MTACNPDKDGQWKVTANAKFRPRPENTQSWCFMEEEEEEEEEDEEGVVNSKIACNPEWMS